MSRLAMETVGRTGHSILRGIQTFAYSWKILVVCAVAALLAVSNGCRVQQETADPRQRIEDGWRSFRLGKYTSAIDAFTKAASLAEGDAELRAKALYGLGSTWNFRKPGNFKDKAVTCYNEAIELVPQSDTAAWSLLALARMKHLAIVGAPREKKNSPEVRAAYQAVIDRFPKHLAGEEAFIYLQECSVVTLKPEEVAKACTALEEFVKTHPHSLYETTAYHLLAECHQVFHRPDDRIRAKRMALELAKEDKVTPIEVNKALFTWLIALYAEFDAGDFDTAREYYKKLIDEYPTFPTVYAAKLALKRLDNVEQSIRQELLDEPADTQEAARND